MNSISKSDIDKNFGKILKDFRIKNGLTQEKLSEKLGISPKYISRIENGSSGIKTQTIINYINVLGITPNILYKDFLTSESLKKQVALSEKLSKLSSEKIDFAISILDLLNNLE